MTEPFSSYTSSPTSPFSEPFPNPHPFSFEEDKSPPPPQPVNSNNFDTFPALDCSYPPPSLPMNLETLALDSQPHQPCISSTIETCFASNQISPKYSSLSSKLDFSNFNHQAPSAPSSSLPSKTQQLPSAAPQLPNLSNKTRNSSIKEDETLKLLKKYYLEALLAQQMDNKMPYDRENVGQRLLLFCRCFTFS